MIEKKLQRQVSDLRVFCSKKGEGCPWKGELRDLETHSRRDCGHVEEECRYGCGGRYQRRLLRDHEMDECPQLPPEVVTQSLIRKMAERIDKLEKAHQEDQTKLTAVQAKLASVEKARDKDQVKFEAMEKKLAKKIDKLDHRLQQHMYRAHLLTLLPPIG